MDENEKKAIRGDPDEQDKGKNAKDNKNEDNYYLSIFCGLMFGLAIGAATDDIGFWILIGLTVGISVGYFPSQKKK